MPQREEIELMPSLKPYAWLGLAVHNPSGTREAVTDCPFCQGQRKFSLNTEKGTWRCLVCAAGSEKGGGNIFTFMRVLWENSNSNTVESDYQALASDRGFLSTNCLKHFGLRKLCLTGEWILPGYSGYGKTAKMQQLYVYRYVKEVNKHRFVALPSTIPGQEIKHCMLGTNHFDPRKEYLYLCEGIWDGCMLVDTLSYTAIRNGVVVKAKANLLLGGINVLAVPGCNVFREDWVAPFAGRKVVMFYDNDYPRTHPKTKDRIDPSSISGMRKVAGILSAADPGPQTLHYLKWGVGDHDPNLPHGYDLRDAFNVSADHQSRAKILGNLFQKVDPIPDDWIPGRSPGTAAKGGVQLECIPCESWKDVRNAWKKAMKWTHGLNKGLACMLATITSTKLAGDQLWMKIIGPPSCGKSVLCEAVSVNRQYIKPLSSIRGFHSGYKTDKEGHEDNSLIPQIKNKTLVTKDGDTLLQAPNLGQILSEARDLYDGTTRSHYRNKAGKEHTALRVTWLLCGTESLRNLDSSELGERFLDCVIVHEMPYDEEDEIAWRVALRAERDVSQEHVGSMATQDSPEIIYAKQLTGGYIEFLRANAPQLVEAVTFPETSLRYCTHLAQFVAFVRARPSTRQEEKAQRELPFRLISQFVRLSKCLAVVMNKSTVDDEVMEIVRHVALDTARGRTMELMRHMYAGGDNGASMVALCSMTGETDKKAGVLLDFLRGIRAVEKHTVNKMPMYRLSSRMKRLYHISTHEPLPNEYDDDEELVAADE